MNAMKVMGSGFLLAVLVFHVTWAMEVHDDSDSDEVQDDEPVKRSDMSPACQRCFHTYDYRACSSCYRRGTVPFYGKRSYNPYDGDDLDKRAYNPYENEIWGGVVRRAYNPYENDGFGFNKRGSFSACRCCFITSESECCNRCPGNASFRGRKRSASPAFYDSDANGDCRCCERSHFNFGCCLMCSKRRK